MWFFLFLVISSTVDLSNAQSKCDIPGMCLGDIHGSTVTDTVEQCIEFCHSTHGCQWYTHDSSNDFCFAFSSCPEIDTACDTCTSGQISCNPLQCFVTGMCQGNFLGYTEAMSQEECLMSCQEIKECAWFTFHLIDHRCMFLEDCELEQENGYFVSGERNCTVKQPDYSKIVIQHGTNVDWINIPVTHYEFAVHKCSPMPDYPENVIGTVGAVIDGQVVICGGWMVARCYVLSRELNIWLEIESMLEPRADTASTMTPYGWWVTGGSSNLGLLDSTELYNSSLGTWTAGPALPSARMYHCIVQINNAMAFFVGGSSNIDGLTNDTWIYSWPEDVWTELPIMPTSRQDMACGIFPDQDGVKHIMVAGGNPDFITVESFNLDTDSWEELPNLPFNGNNAHALVQDGKNIFLINPAYNNTMLFNEESLTFEIINGQGTGVTGSYGSVIPVNDENLHGC